MIACESVLGGVEGLVVWRVVPFVRASQGLLVNGASLLLGLLLTSTGWWPHL